MKPLRIMDDIWDFIQANGYKDFMTYLMIVIIVGSFFYYIIDYLRKEIKKDKNRY